MKGQRDRLGARRTAGGEKVALGWWRDFMLRWEPAARDKKVLKGVRINRAGKGQKCSADGCERIVNLFAERAVAWSRRLGGAGLILRMTENKWPRKRKSHREKTTGDVKTKEAVRGRRGGRLKCRV